MSAFFCMIIHGTIVKTFGAEETLYCVDFHRYILLGTKIKCMILHMPVYPQWDWYKNIECQWI